MRKDHNILDLRHVSDKRVPDVSVVIPSYNSTSVLLDCIASLQNQKTQYLFDIIIVDSSPRDPSESIRKLFPHIKIVHSPERLFPGEARNKGVEKAKGKIVAFTDADCLVPANWIETIGQSFESEKAEVFVGAISNAHPDNLVSLTEFYVQYREFSEFTKRRRIEILPGGNLAILKNFYQSIGGFPHHRAAEDTLFAKNILKNNGKMVFVPSLKVFHRNRTNLYILLINQYLLGYNSAMVRKNSKLPGAYLVNSRLFIPFIPLIRVARTIQFLLKFQGINKIYAFFELVFVFPILILCVNSWSLGFATALNKGSN